MVEQPLIIVKKFKKKAHEHHGGVWKLAYADFVTAMMAFFLLMWLLGSTDETTRKGIAEYFADPLHVSQDAGKDSGDRTAIIPGGGADMTSEDGQVKNNNEITNPEKITEEQIKKKEEAIEKQQFEALKGKIQSKIDQTAELNEYKDQIKLEITPEGLRILIVDNQKRPMYKLASAQTERHIQLILRALAPVINELPNKITLNGHTDALPFPANQKGYTNWELSSDRANAARYELIEGGLNQDKVLRVIGFSSSIPYNIDTQPLDPINRRISIIVMNKKTEEQVLQGSSE